MQLCFGASTVGDVSGHVDSGWPGLKSSGTKPGSTATETGLLLTFLILNVRFVKLFHGCLPNLT